MGSLGDVEHFEVEVLHHWLHCLCQYFRVARRRIPPGRDPLPLRFEQRFRLEHQHPLHSRIHLHWRRDFAGVLGSVAREDTAAAAAAAAAAAVAAALASAAVAVTAAGAGVAVAAAVYGLPSPHGQSIAETIHAPHPGSDEHSSTQR
eukprot:GHVU01215319.1.p4 GENE.GHVU01215319.1~~GHVU01215319.1.p4  ORF type:complete len:147 (-),score=27.45 GHVU01215319.1:1431-1871(-)